jgi:hypothetical protein
MSIVFLSGAPGTRTEWRCRYYGKKKEKRKEEEILVVVVVIVRLARATRLGLSMPAVTKP